MDGNVVTEPFDVTVAAGTPAIRVTITNTGTTAYQFSMVEPALYADDFANGDNPAISLRQDWRYEFVNTSYPTHPLEFIDQTRMQPRPNDTVLVGQDSAGSLSGDTDVNLVENGDTFQITLAGPLVSGIRGYRCAVTNHVNMRGTVNVLQ